MNSLKLLRSDNGLYFHDQRKTRRAAPLWVWSQPTTVANQNDFKTTFCLISFLLFQILEEKKIPKFSILEKKMADAILSYIYHQDSHCIFFWGGDPLVKFLIYFSPSFPSKLFP